MPKSIKKIGIADDAEMDRSELSSVPRGAQRQSFLMHKENKMPIDIEQIMKMVIETDGDEKYEAAIEKSDMSDGDKTIAIVLDRLAKQAEKPDELPEELKRRMAAGGAGFPAPAKKKDPTDPKHRFKFQKGMKKEDGTFDLEKIDEEFHPVFEALNKESKESKPEDAPLSKETEELKKETADLKKENVELRKDVSGLNDKITTTELRKEVENDYDHVPGSTDEKVELLKSQDEDGAKALKKSWKVTEELLSKSGAFGETGVTYHGGDTGSALAKMDQMAVELRKEDTKLTKEAAQARIYKENPEMYEQYRREKAAAQRDMDM